MDKKSYLIRAIYDWCIDNDSSPYILSLVEGKTLIPESLSGSKEIVLNLSPQSIQNLYIDEEGISFKGRFSGKLFNVFLPIKFSLRYLCKGKWRWNFF